MRRDELFADDAQQRLDTVGDDRERVAVTSAPAHVVISQGLIDRAHVIRTPVW